MNIPNHILTVQEITSQIRKKLESSFPRLWLRGELSGVVMHRSGHFYATLKDERAQISLVMWKSRVSSLDFRPENGMEILAYGNLTVYEKGGRYQFDTQVMQPAGRGALAIEFEKLKAALAAEGLFDAERKKKPPLYPRVIAVATSPSGAAIRDILTTLQRRGFGLTVLFQPVKVQGEGASTDIAAKLQTLQTVDPRPDVIILGRGGGSIEDLWAFNEEQTVRAIASSTIPIIAGVGHETDSTLSDYAADIRAATPTAAAELAIPDRQETRQYLTQLANRLHRNQDNRIRMLQSRLERVHGAYGLNRVPDLVRQMEQSLDEIQNKFAYLHEKYQTGLKQKLDLLENRLMAASPLDLLKRGYVVLTHHEKVIASVNDLDIGDRIRLHFHDGKAGAEIQEKTPGPDNLQ